jgi:hypothetical protein
MIPGGITVAEVLAVPAGNERDEMIRKWCVSVWAAWERSHDEIRRLLREELEID